MSDITYLGSTHILTMALVLALVALRICHGKWRQFAYYASVLGHQKREWLEQGAYLQGQLDSYMGRAARREQRELQQATLEARWQCMLLRNELSAARNGMRPAIANTRCDAGFPCTDAAPDDMLAAAIDAGDGAAPLLSRIPGTVDQRATTLADTLNQTGPQRPVEYSLDLPYGDTLNLRKGA